MVRGDRAIGWDVKGDLATVGWEAYPLEVGAARASRVIMHDFGEPGVIVYGRETLAIATMEADPFRLIAPRRHIPPLTHLAGLPCFPLPWMGRGAFVVPPQVDAAFAKEATWRRWSCLRVRVRPVPREHKDPRIAAFWLACRTLRQELYVLRSDPAHALKNLTEFADRVWETFGEFVEWQLPPELAAANAERKVIP